MKVTKIIKESIDNISNEPINSENPFDGIRSNILEMPNGEILYVAYRNGNMVAGSATNTGIIPEHVMEYDNDLSVDQNLQDFYDYIIHSTDINELDDDLTEAFGLEPNMIVNPRLGEFEIVDKDGDYTLLHQLGGGTYPWVVARGLKSNGEWDNSMCYCDLSSAQNFMASQTLDESFEDGNCQWVFKLSKARNDYGEYKVRAYKNGKYDEEATYYTDDWEDAVGTLKDMARNQGLEVVPAFGGKGYIAQCSTAITESRKRKCNRKRKRCRVDEDVDVSDDVEDFVIYTDTKTDNKVLKAEDGYAVLDKENNWLGTINARDDKAAISDYMAGRYKNK